MADTFYTIPYKSNGDCCPTCGPPSDPCSCPEGCCKLPYGFTDVTSESPGFYIYVINVYKCNGDGYWYNANNEFGSSGSWRLYLFSNTSAIPTGCFIGEKPQFPPLIADANNTKVRWCCESEEFKEFNWSFPEGCFTDQDCTPETSITDPYIYINYDDHSEGYFIDGDPGGAFGCNEITTSDILDLVPDECYITGVNALGFYSLSYLIDCFNRPFINLPSLDYFDEYCYIEINGTVPPECPSSCIDCPDWYPYYPSWASTSASGGTWVTDNTFEITDSDVCGGTIDLWSSGVRHSMLFLPSGGTITIDLSGDMVKHSTFTSPDSYSVFGAYLYDAFTFANVGGVSVTSVYGDNCTMTPISESSGPMTVPPGCYYFEMSGSSIGPIGGLRASGASITVTFTFT